jgi:hypothetical protein
VDRDYVEKIITVRICGLGPGSAVRVALYEHRTRTNEPISVEEEPHGRYYIAAIRAVIHI